MKNNKLKVSEYNTDHQIDAIYKSLTSNKRMFKYLIAVNVVYAVSLFMYATKPVKNQTVIQNKDGVFLGVLKNLNTPLRTNASIERRVDSCMRRTFNIQAGAGNNQPNGARGCFTPEGFAELTKNERYKNIIDAVSSSNNEGLMITSEKARITGINTDVLQRSTYQVKAKYIYQVDNGKIGDEDRFQKYQIETTAVVIERPFWQSSYGYGINRIKVRIKSA